MGGAREHVVRKRSREEGQEGRRLGKCEVSAREGKVEERVRKIA